MSEDNQLIEVTADHEGRPRIVDTGLTVRDLLICLSHGHSLDDIATKFSTNAGTLSLVLKDLSRQFDVNLHTFLNVDPEYRRLASLAHACRTDPE